jgi:hypothetical protein
VTRRLVWSGRLEGGAAGARCRRIRIADRSGGFRVLRFSMENAGPPTGAQVLLEVP